MLTRLFTQNELRPAFAPEEAVKITARLPIGPRIPAGQVLGFTNTAARNDVKTITITGTPTGGTWTFTFLGQVSSSLAFNATAATVQAAVDAFFGPSCCTVTGGPGPGTPWVLTFTGMMGNVLIKSFTVTGSFTGGTTPAIAIANTTTGSAGAGQMDIYDDSTVPTAHGLLAIDYVSDINGGLLTERGGSGQPYNPPVYIGGFFRVADLTGLDANGLADLGRMAVGSAFNTAGGVIYLT